MTISINHFFNKFLMWKIKLNNLKLALKYFFQLHFVMPFQKEIVLTLNGGLGDVILDSMVLLRLRQKFPNKQISIFYRDDNTDSSLENFSFGKTRKYSSLDGKKINPIEEWLNALKFIGLLDTLTGINIDKNSYGMRIYPEVMRKLIPDYEPIDFKKNILDKIFEQYYTPSVKVKEVETILSNNKVVSIHLRRNADLILRLANKLEKKYLPTFIILGSTEHQKIPKFDFENQINLIDSYTKGYNLFDVLYLSSKSDYFIGGRGGFELFHWLIGVKSINFFDQVGFREIETGWWNKNLWESNEIDKLFQTETPINTALKRVRF